VCVSSSIILDRLVNKAQVEFQHCTQTTLKSLIWMDFVMFVLHMHEMFYGLDKKWTPIKRKMVEI
jgi:hypothetical protein